MTEKKYKWVCRGVGMEWTPGCFICGYDKLSEKSGTELHANVSAFVSSKKEGKELVTLFGKGTYLDYRPREPNWIQVKVGACKAHKKNLNLLESEDGMISESQIREAQKVSRLRTTN
jgi:uncharacterized Fe-S cluster-containing MiaB family protein